MIQRKQTLFLIISAVLTGLTLLFPFAEFLSNHGTISIHAFEIHDNDTQLLEEPVPVLTMGITIIIISLISLTTIFLYTKRLLQIRLVRYTIILKVAIIAVLIYFAYILQQSQVDLTIVPGNSTLCIVLAFVFDILAIYGIKQDEKLVKSVDRIR
ncbi:MAG: DUF4293 domain-containing protein [Bacteroidales bacterium]